ncbi:hypothetical protein [Hoyosella subflava]|uniref:Uncharacterized protein n=1 Tax=Hoyosella subflava (strain DSM 45089 / JCM 17490 / NBRC 109087 / DQS3-9A1) TaxID=443218 RepID=F6EIH7_HOYSD|nr:hypothetical protein [Hoyosella subflava]AEF42469.1 hypothetical protein AS9A_4035 [Hoyosella subflava DQS3-9A1]
MTRRHAAPASLASVAFGATPVVPPFPRADTPERQWLRGVALGAAGFYAAAQAQLVENVRTPLGVRGPSVDLAVRSLSFSTMASFQRQLGRYSAAATLDGQALQLATTASDTTVIRAADGAESQIAEAWCDAITGLAADAIGVWRLGVAGRLLERLDEELERCDVGDSKRLWRQWVRRDWVRCELALYSGAAATGRRYAESARDRARRCASVRHQIKSELMVAAALSATGDASGASTLAARCLYASESHGLYPLAWAAACLIPGESGADERKGAFERVLHRRGGVFV